MALKLALVAALVFPVVQADDPVAVVDAFHLALSAGDRDAALAHLDADVRIFEGGGAEMSRDEYASHHLGGDITFAAAMTREITHREHNVAGDVAYVLSRTRTTGTFREREIDSIGTETMVLRQGDDGWRIVHIHWSSRRAPE